MIARDRCPDPRRRHRPRHSRHRSPAADPQTRAFSGQPHGVVDADWRSPASPHCARRRRPPRRPIISTVERRRCRSGPGTPRSPHGVPLPSDDRFTGRCRDIRAGEQDEIVDRSCGAIDRTSHDRRPSSAAPPPRQPDRRATTSRLVAMTASGLRSSCDVSWMNSRCRSTPASTRSSIASNVSASSRSSSSGPPRSIRRDRSVAWISLATPVIRPIGAQRAIRDQPSGSNGSRKEPENRPQREPAEVLERPLVDSLLERHHLALYFLGDGEGRPRGPMNVVNCTWRDTGWSSRRLGQRHS